MFCLYICWLLALGWMCSWWENKQIKTAKKNLFPFCSLPFWWYSGGHSCLPLTLFYFSPCVCCVCMHSCMVCVHMCGGGEREREWGKEETRKGRDVGGRNLQVVEGDKSIKIHDMRSEGRGHGRSGSSERKVVGWRRAVGEEDELENIIFSLPYASAWTHLPVLLACWSSLAHHWTAEYFQRNTK